MSRDVNRIYYKEKMLLYMFLLRFLIARKKCCEILRIRFMEIADHLFPFILILFYWSEVGRRKIILRIYYNFHLFVREQYIPAMMLKKQWCGMKISVNMKQAQSDL